MHEVRQSLRRYLRTRIALGDPELFLAAGTREQVLAQVARLMAGGITPAGDRTPAGGRTPEADKPLEAAAPILGSAGQSGLAQAVDGRLAGQAVEDLGQVAAGCRKCELHRTRLNVVFGEGAVEARVLCVGEAPGANEDRTGRPFVGRAGKLLDQILAASGLPRETVYICNVLKCRPPANRNPLPGEIEECSPYLREQIRLVDPEVIVAFGTFAARTLLGSTQALGKLRGRLHVFEGVPLVATYHPAALLRNPGWVRPTWEDMQLVREVLDGDVHRGETDV